MAQRFKTVRKPGGTAPGGTESSEAGTKEEELKVFGKAVMWPVKDWPSESGTKQGDSGPAAPEMILEATVHSPRHEKEPCKQLKDKQRRIC